MSDIKKDHSIGEGTGAVAGAITGAAVGSAGGPVGTVVGAIVGGAVGAKAGDSVAEAINPTDYDKHFEATYATRRTTRPSDWNDYQPAYRTATTRMANTAASASRMSNRSLERTGTRPAANSRLAWRSQGRGAAMAGITSNARCRATPTTTVAKPHPATAPDQRTRGAPCP